jgi:hypothetical protein
MVSVKVNLHMVCTHSSAYLHTLALSYSHGGQKRRNWTGSSSEPGSQYGSAFLDTGESRDVQ